MLFCTSLIALVGASSPTSPASHSSNTSSHTSSSPASSGPSSRRKLQIVNTKRQSMICELLFPTSILAVKMNRKTLCIVLEHEIYIYDISNMRLLHVIETQANPEAVCALSPSVECSYLAYPAPVPSSSSSSSGASGGAGAGANANPNTTGGGGGTGDVLLFSTRSLTVANAIQAHKSPLSFLSLNSSGTLLATSSEKGTVIRVWSVPGAEKLYQFRRGTREARIYLVFEIREGGLGGGTGGSGGGKIGGGGESDKGGEEGDHGTPEGEDDEVNAGVSMVLRKLHEMQTTFNANLRNAERTWRLREERDQILQAEREKNIVKVIEEALQGAIGRSAPTKSRRTPRSTDAVGELKEDPNKNRFKRYLRHFVQCELLKLHRSVQGKKNVSEPDAVPEEEHVEGDTERRLLERCPPLTEEELTAYENRERDCIHITPGSFRFDFTLPMAHEFNKDALYVATHSFQKALKQGKYGRSDPNGPLPRSFMETKYLSASMHNHFKYLKIKYQTLQEEDKTRREALTKHARATRRGTLYNKRATTVMQDPRLAVHAVLIERAGRNSVSDEETDEEKVGGESIPILKKVIPAWRSIEFGNLYQEIDEVAREMRSSSLGKRRKPSGVGPLLRSRKGGKKTEEHAPPAGLWRNCFDEDWLALKRGWELTALAIIEKDYDFEHLRSPNPFTTMDFRKVQDIWAPTRANALAISPSGTRLATGDIDGTILIWTVETGKIESKFTEGAEKGGITYLEWDCERDSLLYVGTERGTVYTFDIQAGEGSQVGAHIDGFVSAIATGKLKGTQLVAFAAGKNIIVSSKAASGLWEQAQCQDPPRLAGSSEEEEILPVGLRWVDGGEGLIVAYLQHGIMYWSRNSLDKPQWRIVPIHSGRRIASFDVSSDGKFIAVTNLVTGIDIYSVKTRRILKHIPTSLDALNNVPLLNAQTGEPIESLPHPGLIVQIIKHRVCRNKEMLVSVTNDNREIYVWTYDWDSVWSRRAFVVKRHFEIFLRENGGVITQVAVVLLAFCLVPQSRKLVFKGCNALLRLQQSIFDAICAFWVAFLTQIANAAMSSVNVARDRVRRWLGISDMEERFQEFVCAPDVKIPIVWWRKCRGKLPWIKKE
ncbi:hypothetical protein NMY22_g16924 [Coprinellus aureogranulatus]|nr:hypothetical protein NMY22_g16924 [Coprinellus aureogranulatus]